MGSGPDSAPDGSAPESVPRAASLPESKTCRPAAALPRSPVTQSRSPGSAPERRTMSPSAASPITVTESTSRGAADVSPPTTASP